MSSNDTSAQTPAQTPPPGSSPGLAAPARTGYAQVNGLSLYYEIRGSGAPLVLLHGGLGAIETMSATLSALAGKRQVIAVDLHAHGRTASIDRPLSYEHMADDIAGLLGHLGIERADIMGYSLGGGVALQTAFRHPQLVRRLVVVSVPARRSAWYDEVRAAMEHLGPGLADMMKQSPGYQLYAKVAPRPQDFPVLLAKTGELIRRDYDWSKEIAALKMPALIVFADADSVHPSHVVEIYGLLGGGQRDAGWDGAHRPTAQLAILPGTTHYDIFMSPLLAMAANAFLDGGTK
jgi:pimeloyl-ACP methyl ester carboxylesterase